jgi:hypothetical protein
MSPPQSGIEAKHPIVLKANHCFFEAVDPEGQQIHHLLQMQMDVLLTLCSSRSRKNGTPVRQETEKALAPMSVDSVKEATWTLMECQLTSLLEGQP